MVHVDTDDHYWAPVDPPFSVKRTPQERVHSIKNALRETGWVLSGACQDWGKEIVDQADLIVFTTLDTPLCIKRLRAREKARFGTRIEEGGDMFNVHMNFIEWAKGYDDPNFRGRNIEMHERWLKQQRKPILRIDSTCPPQTATKAIIDQARAQTYTQSCTT